MRRERTSIAAALAALLVFTSAPKARADDTATAAALDLFEKGRRLMTNEATLGEACRVLEEALKLADRGDFLLNVAECHRRQGKLASAYAEFDRALKVGAAVGFEAGMKAAQRFRDYVADRLSHVTITVPPDLATLPDLEVRVADQPWPRERWNKAVASDGGKFEVTATAKGYLPFHTTFTLAVEKEDKAVAIALEKEPPPKPVVVIPPPPGAIVRPARPIWPFVVGGAGVVLGGVGIGFEVASQMARREVENQCPNPRCTTQSRYTTASNAYQEDTNDFHKFVGLGVTGLVALGAAGVGLGLWWRADQKAQAGPSGATVGVVPGPGSLLVTGSF